MIDGLAVGAGGGDVERNWRKLEKEMGWASRGCHSSEFLYRYMDVTFPRHFYPCSFSVHTNQNTMAPIQQKALINVDLGEAVCSLPPQTAQINY